MKIIDSQNGNLDMRIAILEMKIEDLQQTLEEEFVDDEPLTAEEVLEEINRNLRNFFGSTKSGR